MNAQLRWRAVACANHMDFVDALAPFEVTNQPSDAAVGVAIYLWQEQRDIKLHLVSHNAILFCRRRRLGSDRDQRAGKGEGRGDCKMRSPPTPPSPPAPARGAGGQTQGPKG